MAKVKVKARARRPRVSHLARARSRVLSNLFESRLLRLPLLDDVPLRLLPVVAAAVGKARRSSARQREEEGARLCLEATQRTARKVQVGLCLSPSSASSRLRRPQHRQLRGVGYVGRSRNYKSDVNVRPREFRLPSEEDGLAEPTAQKHREMELMLKNKAGRRYQSHNYPGTEGSSIHVSSGSTSFDPKGYVSWFACPAGSIAHLNAPFRPLWIIC